MRIQHSRIFLQSHRLFQVCLRHSRVQLLVVAATLPCHLFQPALEQGTKEEKGEPAYRSATATTQQNRSGSGDGKRGSPASNRSFVEVKIVRKDDVGCRDSRLPFRTIASGILGISDEASSLPKTEPELYAGRRGIAGGLDTRRHVSAW